MMHQTEPVQSEKGGDDNALVDPGGPGGRPPLPPRLWPAGSQEKHAAHLAYMKMGKGYRECLSLRGKELIQQAGIPIRECGLSDIPKFEQVLKTNIVVISMKAGNEKVYNGCGQFEEYMFLYHSELNGQGHFDLITKMTGFTYQAYYCNFCQKSYSKRDKYSCTYSCNICGRSNCKQSAEMQDKYAV